MTETTWGPSLPEGADRPRRRSWIGELPFLIGVVIVLILVLKAFLFQAFFIPSESMERTLHGCTGCAGDRVLVNKLVYDFRGIHRGEIVVFNGKGTNFPEDTTTKPPANGIQAAARWLQRALGLGAPGERDFIKRVIGLPGDEVQCCRDGHVVVNGEALHESYLFEDDHYPFCSAGKGNLVPNNGPACTADSAPYVVPPHYLFVMGDHRSRSSDSRYNGAIPERTVVGRAFVRIWPPGRWGLLPVPSIFTHHAAALAAQAPLVVSFGLALPITVVRRRRRASRAVHR